MNARRYLFVVVAASVAVLVLAGDALACACCDGGGGRTLIGWSSSGRSALIEHDQWAACEHRHGYEVWRMGAAAPSHCFDHYGENPDARTGCGFEGQVDAYEAEQAGRSARPGTRAGLYPGAPRAIHRKHLVVTVAPEPPSEDAPCNQPSRLTVALRLAPTEPLSSTVICLGAPDDVSDSLREGEWMPNPITVSVHPAPRGERALVFYRGDDASPGMGYFDTTVVWARLPSALRDPAPLAALSTTSAPDAEVLALPTPRRRARGPEHTVANRYNREGLAAHRSGDFDTAAAHFYRAVWRDPGHVFAWYNLACAEARQGHVERAMDIMETLAAWDCASCRERVRRAESDPDLAAIVSRPEMRRLIESSVERE